MIILYLVMPKRYIQLTIQKPRILAHQGKVLEQREIPYLESVKMVLKNWAFLRMGFSITFLYFVVTCIQFWFSDYMITVMNLPKEIVFTIFGVVSVTGPVFGVILGGIISSKLGGYNEPKSLYVTAILSFFACACALPISFLPESLVILQVSLLWCLLFSGGFTMPSITGVMLNTVPEDLKTTANSISNTFNNIFGFLPSPYLYGYIADMGGVVGANKRTAMFVNMCMSIPVAFLICYQALLTRYQSKK